MLGLAFAAPVLALAMLLLLERVERGLDRVRRPPSRGPGRLPLWVIAPARPQMTGAA